MFQRAERTWKPKTERCFCYQWISVRARVSVWKSVFIHVLYRVHLSAAAYSCIRLFSQLPSSTEDCARETCLPPHSLYLPVLLFLCKCSVSPPSCAFMPIRLFISAPKWQQANRAAWLWQYYNTNGAFLPEIWKTLILSEGCGFLQVLKMEGKGLRCRTVQQTQHEVV